MQEENFCGLTEQKVQLPEAAEQEDNIGIYRPGLLESSLRSIGWRLVQDCLGPSPAQAAPPLNITHGRHQKQRASFFPWLGKIVSNFVMYMKREVRGGGLFIFIFFLPSLNILESVYIHCPLPPPHSSPLALWH